MSNENSIPIEEHIVQIAAQARELAPADVHPSVMLSVRPIFSATYTHALFVGETEVSHGFLCDVADIARRVDEEIGDSEDSWTGGPEPAGDSALRD